jgi:penicillin-binding protein 1A
VSAADRDARPRARAKGRGKGGGGAGGGKARGRWRWVRLVASVVLVLGALGLGGVIGLFVYFGSDPNLPSIQKLSDYRPPQTTRVLDRNGRLLGTLGPQRRTVMPYQQIPKVLVHAVIAAEDPHYFQHEGLDYRGMLRAFIENLMRGRFAQGGSTITQQVVKEMLLSREKTLRRKVQEIILARQLSEALSKEEILEIYLNQINYGHARYGCEEGARFYFGKSVTEVDVGEAAFLAGVPQLPERLSPYKNPEGAKNRQRYVLGQMVKHGYLDAKTADRVAAAALEIMPEPTAQLSPAPEAVDSVYRMLVERFGREAVPTLGTAVRTSIDLDLQKGAREALERGLEELDGRQRYRERTGRLTGKALERRRAELTAARKGALPASAIVEGIVDRVEKDPANPKGGKLHVDVGGLVGVVDLAAEVRYGLGGKPLAERFSPGDLVRVRAAPERRRVGDRDGKELLLALELGPQGALVILDPHAREILALVGAYNYRPGGFDRAQRALRQAGSAFKPFVYGAALESGRFTAATLVNDTPDVYDLWKPQNYEKGTFRGPIRVRTALADSVNTVAIKVLNDIGVPAAKDFAVRSGIATAMPEDLGLALALGANSVSPLELANAYATLAAGGRREPARLVLAVGDEETERGPAEAAMTPETAYLVTSLMRSVVEQGTARAAATRLKRPLAGKTGTSNGQKDAWFAGFSPDLLAVVWVGFDDGKSLGAGEAGGKSALPIWIDVMNRALAGRPVRDFAQPPGVAVVRIEPRTGLLAAPGGEAIEEVFLPGAEGPRAGARRDRQPGRAAAAVAAGRPGAPAFRAASARSRRAAGRGPWPVCCAPRCPSRSRTSWRTRTRRRPGRRQALGASPPGRARPALWRPHRSRAAGPPPRSGARPPRRGASPRLAELRPRARACWPTGRPPAADRPPPQRRPACPCAPVRRASARGAPATWAAEAA